MSAITAIRPYAPVIPARAGVPQISLVPTLRGPTGTPGSPDTAFKLDTGSPYEVARTSRQRLGDSRSIKDYGAALNGVADDTEAWEDALNSLLDGEYRHLHHPGGRSEIDDTTELPQIVADRVAITGIGPGSELHRGPGAGTCGKFFKFGETSPADPATYLMVDGLKFSLENTPDPDDYAVDCEYINTVFMGRIYSGNLNLGTGQVDDSLASVLRCSRVGQATFRDWKAWCDKGAGAAANLYFADVSTVRLVDFDLAALWSDCTGDAAGKILHLQVTSGGSIDTLFLHRFHAQMCNVALTGAASVGKPYGIYFDQPAGLSPSLTNFWMGDSIVDHTTLAALKAKSEVGSTSNARPWWVGRNRMFTDKGIGIDIEHLSGFRRVALDINGNYVVIQDNNPAIRVAGTGIRSADVTGNKCLDRTKATTKDAAIVMDCDDFHIGPNHIGTDEETDGSTGWQAAVKIASTSAANFSVDPQHAPFVPVEVVEPAYSDVISDQRMITRKRTLQTLDPRQKSGFRDDFDQHTLSSRWKADVIGSNGSIVAFAIPAAQEINGVVQGTTGADAGGTHALNGIQISTPLVYRVVNGGLVAQFRLRVNLLTNVALFAGFTDQIAALEMPFTLGGGDALTSNATDAVGILFDTAAATDQWCLVGVKADVDATKAFTGAAPPGSSTYEEWRIELDSTGNAKFYKDGVLAGSVANAVTDTTLLAFQVAAFGRNGTQKNVVMEYADIWQGRR